MYLQRGILIVVLYEDDLIMSGQTDSEIDKLVSSLPKSLMIKDLGVPVKFLRIGLNWETRDEVSMNKSTVGK